MAIFSPNFRECGLGYILGDLRCPLGDFFPQKNNLVTLNRTPVFFELVKMSFVCLFVYKKSWTLSPCKNSVRTYTRTEVVFLIEIEGAVLKEACLKKGEFFQVITTQLCALKREVLKKCSFEVNYLVRGQDLPIFYKVFFTAKKCWTSANPT
jgi:hypothetical protein